MWLIIEPKHTNPPNFGVEPPNFGVEPNKWTRMATRTGLEPVLPP